MVCSGTSSNYVEVSSGSYFV